jgi:hypothetical protein
LTHYNAQGKAEDTPSGQPARQIFNPKTGDLLLAFRYHAGECQGELTHQELVELAIEKGIAVDGHTEPPPSLPESLQRYSCPDLRPA